MKKILSLILAAALLLTAFQLTVSAVEERAYYVVGSFNIWNVSDDYKMTRNEGAGTEEYVLEGLALKTSDELRVAKVYNNSMQMYPIDAIVNYGENGEITKDDVYNVYFRPDGDGGDDWFYNCIYVVAQPAIEYDLWLGSTRVTSKNKNDILGDGKAQFDPDTGVLTLSDPVISGDHEFERKTAKIYTKTTITVKGSYHMTSASDFGIYAENCNLTLSGDFTFRGNGEGIHAHHYLTIESGSVKAVGNSYGINSNWTMAIKKDAKRVEAEGHMAYYGNTISIQGDQKLTFPKGGYIYSGQWVMDANGNYAGHMVIQKPVTLELDGQGTSGSPYLIKDADDWNNLADYIDSGADTRDVYFKLANDISVTTMVGANFPFSGYFDGDGKTLTVNLTSNSSYCAPFSTISDATIINLRTEGTVTCGIHGSGLVGRASGGTNDIIDCVVNVNITTSQSHSGGIIGHGGDKGKTTLLRCVFSGSITGATYGATLWGWSDTGTAVILDNCIDISDTTYPIGYGSPQPILQNVYYTHEKTPLTNFRPWEDNGKRAYSVTGVDLTLVGDTGIQYDGVVYAAKGETVSLKVPEAQLPCIASTGKLVSSGETLKLTMSEQDVLLTPQTCEEYSGLYDGHSNVGNKDEGGEKLTDGNLLTKWCVSKASFPISMTFRSIDEIKVSGYVLWTAEDTGSYPGRNPVSWTLEGSKDGESWTVLTNVKDNNYLAEANYTANTFGLTNPSDEIYSYFRFTVNKIKEGTTFQLSELQLLAEGAPVNYDLWVGSTRVSSKNQDDILGDGGKAKYDPQTHTLTLCDPIIDTNYAPTENRGPFKIYAENTDLIVKGSYHMTDEPKFGIYADDDTDLTLDGNFTFNGYDTAIYGNENVTLTSGVIVADGGEHYDIFCAENLTIEDGIEKIEVTNGIRSYEAFTLGSKLVITTPENGKIGRDKSDTYYCVLDSDGNKAGEVVIRKSEPYNLWLGATQVTSLNMDDILGDGGKAKFDPETNTLTLSDPVIDSNHESVVYSCRIYSEGLDLTVKGSYHMTKDNLPTYGIFSDNGSLTLDGDFTFTGEYYTLRAAKKLTLAGGTITLSGKAAIGAFAQSIEFENGIERFESFSDGAALYAPGVIKLGSELVVISPENAPIQRRDDFYYTVVDADQQPAAHVVIEKNPLLGDADCDGVISVLDATCIQKKLASIPVEKFNPIAADTDKDTKVTILDATYIQKHLASMSTPYVIGEPVFVIEKEDVYVVAGDADLFGSAWNPQIDQNVMTKNDSGVYSITLSGVPASSGETYQFRVVRFIKGEVNDKEWIGDENTEFRTTAAGDVIVTYDPATGEVKVSGEYVKEPLAPYEKIVAVGNGSGGFLNDKQWDPTAEENVMTEVSPGVYQITFNYVQSDYYQFKFVADENYGISWGSVTEDQAWYYIPYEAKFNGKNICFDTDDTDVKVTLILDLSNWDPDTQTGATFMIKLDDPWEYPTEEPTGP